LFSAWGWIDADGSIYGKIPRTRSARNQVRDPHKPADLPDGEYGFLEFYCNEPGCDCRRVMIDVLRPETGWSKIWATISYGWESLDFYRKWGGIASDPIETKGPYLDPLNPQTKYSPALLIWSDPVKPLRV
jgi:hypothetical protein